MGTASMTPKEEAILNGTTLRNDGYVHVVLRNVVTTDIDRLSDTIPKFPGYWPSNAQSIEDAKIHWQSRIKAAMLNGLARVIVDRHPESPSWSPPWGILLAHTDAMDSTKAILTCIVVTDDETDYCGWTDPARLNRRVPSEVLKAYARLWARKLGRELGNKELREVWVPA